MTGERGPGSPINSGRPEESRGGDSPGTPWTKDLRRAEELKTLQDLRWRFSLPADEGDDGQDWQLDIHRTALEVARQAFPLALQGVMSWLPGAAG